MKSGMSDLNVLAISISNVQDKNRIFEDYCHGIKANSKNYYFVDYFELYLKMGKKAFEKHIKNLVITKKIDYIFFILMSGDLTLDIYFIERLSKRAFIIMNFFDSPIFFETVDRYYAQVADLILLPDYLIKYQYEILNINAICTFSLFNKDYYRKFENINKSIDISFVGDVTRKKRMEYIDFLRKNNIPIRTYGRGSEEGFADFNQMMETFNKSKINLNFTGIINSNNLILGKKIANRINLCNGRSIEIALCGGFVLAEYANGMEKMFKIGEEIDTFHTKDELLDKIKFYLANESEREKIAKKGHERAIRDYDTSEGFLKVFDAITKIRRSNKIIYLDQDFLSNYVSCKFYYMTRFLLLGRFRNFFEELKIFCRFGKISYSQVYAYILKAISIHLDKYPVVKIKLKRYLKIFIKY
ncbi:MAG: glycosyltransferase [Candidatus Methanoperedens sp.]